MLRGDIVMDKKAYLYCRNYEAVDRACIMWRLQSARRKPRHNG